MIYVIETGVGHVYGGESENSVAAQSMKLDALVVPMEETVLGS